MISEKEAIDSLWNLSFVNTQSKVDVDDLIKKIYKSIGSCESCGLLKKCDVFTYNGEQKYPNICGKHLMPVKKDFHCADYEPKKNR